MSHSVRCQLSFCGSLGIAVLVMLLGIGCGGKRLASPKGETNSLDAQPKEITNSKDQTISPAAQPKEITNSIGMKLVLIPAGKFMMGSPMDEKDRSDQ